MTLPEERTPTATPRARVVIVTPAWADANNGNWQTARRWARHLAGKHTVQLTDRWPDGHRLRVSGPHDTPLSQAQVLLALHAGRSAASIQSWHQAHGPGGLVVVLTGTDLYRDFQPELHHDRPADPTRAQAAQAAQVVHQSLQQAGHLVVLQDQAPLDLPAPLRAKARVVFQSTTPRQHLTKSDPARYGLRALMVGHLRDEKDPATLQRAAALIRPDEGIRIDHLGAALHPRFEAQALATAQACPHYRWRGASDHEATRRRIQRAHVLVHTSRLEGGAHVIMEALCSGTPVLASRMAGNIGMLGADHPGFFDVGDAAALANLLRRFQHDPGFRQALLAHGAARAPLFSPQREAAALLALVDEASP